MTSAEAEVFAVPAVAGASAWGVCAEAADAKGTDTLGVRAEGVQQGFTRLPRTHA